MNANTRATNSAQWLNLVQQKVQTLRFGVVQIVVHEGQVVQIDRTEKTRIDRREATDFAPSQD